MSYSGPDYSRMKLQSKAVRQLAGATATWRHYVSASGAVGVAGFSDTPCYVSKTITGIFGQGLYAFPKMIEMQLPAGERLAGEFYAVTDDPLGLQDEIDYDGQTYRVEGLCVRMTMGYGYITKLKIGSGT